MRKINNNSSELTKKVGKKFFFSDDITLASKLDYESGISEFDTYLNGKKLEDINAVIHLTKYPKGIVFKIAKHFSSLPVGIPYSEIKLITLNEDIVKSNFIIETIDNKSMVFSFKTENILEVRRFLDDIKLKYDYKTFKTNDIVKKRSSIVNIKHPIPTLISFFVPGLGQFIKGHFLKSITIWVVGSIIGVFLWWTYIIPFIIWVLNVYDTYNSNEDWKFN